MIEINLLPEERRFLRQKTQGVDVNIVLPFLPYIGALLALVHLVLAVGAFIDFSQLKVLEGRWKKFEPRRAELESFNKEFNAIEQDVKALESLGGVTISWSQKLNALSDYLPSGVWFDELSISNKSLIIKGSVMSLERQEMELINQFIDNLKKDKQFFKDFAKLQMGMLKMKTLGTYEVADFELLGIIK